VIFTLVIQIKCCSLFYSLFGYFIWQLYLATLCCHFMATGSPLDPCKIYHACRDLSGGRIARAWVAHGTFSCFFCSSVRTPFISATTLSSTLSLLSALYALLSALISLSLYSHVSLSTLSIPYCASSYATNCCCAAIQPCFCCNAAVLPYPVLPLPCCRVLLPSTDPRDS
jgi:hypothetical protein